MLISWWRIGLLSVAVLAAVGVTSCGLASDDDEASSGSADDTAEPASSDGYRCTVGGSIEFDSAIGWQATGPAASTIDVVETLTNDGGTFDQNNTYVIDEPRLQLYTAFINAATVEFAVVEGGPVEVELFFGNVVEGGDFGEYEVTETLEVHELAAGESITLSADAPCA